MATILTKRVGRFPFPGFNSLKTAQPELRDFSMRCPLRKPNFLRIIWKCSAFFAKAFLLIRDDAPGRQGFSRAA
jgi:hypothetical protein